MENNGNPPKGRGGIVRPKIGHCCPPFSWCLGTSSRVQSWFPAILDQLSKNAFQSVNRIWYYYRTFLEIKILFLYFCHESLFISKLELFYNFETCTNKVALMCSFMVMCSINFKYRPKKINEKSDWVRYTLPFELSNFLKSSHVQIALSCLSLLNVIGSSI